MEVVRVQLVKKKNQILKDIMLIQNIKVKK